jgi:5-enolpyruvylshikimate-3-phosphate synthase
MTAELTRWGALVEARPDGMVINGRERLTGGKVLSHGDHRIAKAWRWAGMGAASRWRSRISTVGDLVPRLLGAAGALAGFQGK